MSYPFPDEAKKIVVAPLNWGLGHASRCIPIIKTCLAEGKEVIIATDGQAFSFLKEEFPDCSFENISSYNIKYRSDSFLSIALDNFINIIIGILGDRRSVNYVYKKYKPDFILSDSRFGFWHKKVPNAIISHQLNFQSNIRIISFIVNLINAFFINQFNDCWIPDSNNHKYAGLLSKSIKIKNQTFIGLQSSLSLKHYTKSGIGIVLSGPEPARTKLESILISLLSNRSDVVLVRGTQHPLTKKPPLGWKVYNVASRNEIEQLYQSSDKIICRSGYTSIMDLYHLNCKAILIPTPGQTEQEYLAQLHSKSGFTSIKENELESLVKLLD